MENKTFLKDGVPTMQVSDPNALDQYELIDVRGPDEFVGELAHIHGAKLVTLGEELDSYLENADKNKKILFICRSGMRSAGATIEAMELGFKEVYNMEGGMILWNQNAFPTERS